MFELVNPDAEKPSLWGGGVSVFSVPALQKSLTDLIRGVRANKKNEAQYIATCFEEIRRELKQNDPDVKAQAVSKLTYVSCLCAWDWSAAPGLHMLGYEIGLASFHIVEVMSSPNFINKRAGYLAAVQSFRQDTDVLMLTTNLLRKVHAATSFFFFFFPPRTKALPAVKLSSTRGYTLSLCRS
ncbi:MAG: hypothetical protein BJ554DRAFT_5301 [Olpidium bornovanus]|uniref:Clathrin/coatomer adaptor adaptin-like N-terminal domain-containing protein n=1 Tax=Olpidium bornovanus TaxID=278681 RepID=A0A8H7ZZU0_9FUNG|nr:MAG: hypothetical protein BJ554DRAFT_5301 [Olpidium bornovanus]